MQPREGKLKPKKGKSKEPRKERRKRNKITRNQIAHLPSSLNLMKTEGFISFLLFLQCHRHQDIVFSLSVKDSPRLHNTLTLLQNITLPVRGGHLNPECSGRGHYTVNCDQFKN